MSQKNARKIRQEVRKLSASLATELKTFIRDLNLGARIVLAIKIILKKEW